MNTKGTVWSNSVAQYFKNFEVFLHECLTLSQPEPADESVGEHDEIEPRFEWKSIEGVVKWVCQLVKKIETAKTRECCHAPGTPELSIVDVL